MTEQERIRDEGGCVMSDQPIDELRRYTLDDQLTCVRRELALRKSAYPKWVKSGRMKQEVADREINCMQAVHDTLAALLQRLHMRRDYGR